MKAGLTGAILSEKPNVKVGKLYTGAGIYTSFIPGITLYACLIYLLGTGICNFTPPCPGLAILLPAKQCAWISMLFIININ